MWSLMILKPDIVAHPPLLQAVLRELLDAGVIIRGARKLQMTSNLAEQLYEAHKGPEDQRIRVRLDFYSGPVIAMCVNGDVRRILGSSQLYPLPTDGQLGTLRQRYALSDVRNVAHASDPGEADRELALFEPFSSPESLLNSILT